MKNTKIEYCDHTWSPWYGCTKVSPGCANCFAERWAERTKFVEWGPGKPRRLASEAKWKEPLRWNIQGALGEFVNATRNEGDLHAYPERVMAHTVQTVLVDLCDPFDPEIDTKWLAKFLHLVVKTENLTWLLLTKRPANIAMRLEDIGWHGSTRWPVNVWLGVSVEDQQRADERIPALLRVPCAHRWVSVEPLLGPVDLSLSAPCEFGTGLQRCPRHAFKWVVVGGESGPRARPCNVEWIRDIVRRCKSAGVPCFVKQIGSRPYDSRICETGEEVGAYRVQHPKGGEPSEWPEDLRVREMPKA